MFDLIFITTFIKRGYIEQMLDSTRVNDKLNLLVVVVAQNNVELDYAQYQSPHTTFHEILVEGQLNSSAARNVGIDYVLQSDIKSKFVMFPDDDSSFDDSFFNNFSGSIDSQHCYLTDIYKTSGDGYFMKVTNSTENKMTKYMWNSVGAVNMIVNYNTFIATGRFDEMMGVAAKYGAGEDSDYYIRSIDSGAHYIYTKDLYSFHPSGNESYKSITYKSLLRRFKNYGRGVVYMLVKHKMYGHALKISFKALLGCGLRFITFDFKMSFVYLYAFFARLTTFTSLLFHKF